MSAQRTISCSVEFRNLVTILPFLCNQFRLVAMGRRLACPSIAPKEQKFLAVARHIRADSVRGGISPSWVPCTLLIIASSQ